MSYPNTRYSNYILVECSVDKKHIHRERWRVDFRSLTGKKIEIHRKRTRLRTNQLKHYRYNVIVVDLYMSRADFLKTLRRHFSIEMSCQPEDIQLEWEDWVALWGEPKQ